MGKPQTCCIKGCEDGVRSLSFCSHHYHQWNRYGHPLASEVKFMRHMQRAQDTLAYRKWCGMINRCHDPRAAGYENYGGREIKVCDRWRASFIAFREDMGDCPEDHSLDRINNDGNYEPGNCRWATNETQGRNRRTTVLDMDTVISFRERRAKGEMVSTMAREIGANYDAVYQAMIGRSWRVTA